MQYPVMETEHKNVFEPQPVPDPGKHKELTGPMFKIDRKHQYTGLDMQGGYSIEKLLA